MTEFNNRIAAQRDILVAVNSVPWREELFGLSKLFFLANKSQEQVTSEYKLLSLEVADLMSRIKNAVKRQG